MTSRWCHSDAMDLAPYVDSLRHELAVAADAGGEDARALAERLTAPLESATRLVLLDALATAAEEITRELAPGSVDVRLRGRNPDFVVTPPPSDEPLDGRGAARGVDAATGGRATSPPGGSGGPTAAAPPTDADDAGTSRVTLRLAESLKSRAEAAAGQVGLSVNAWLVRAVAAALEPDDRDRGSVRPTPRGGQRYTGWVR